MNRRSFLATLGGAAIAPAIVRAASLMPIVARPEPIIGLCRPSFAFDASRYGWLSVGRDYGHNPLYKTNFAELTAAQKRVWSEELMRAACRQAFMAKFAAWYSDQMDRITYNNLVAMPRQLPLVPASNSLG